MSPSTITILFLLSAVATSVWEKIPLGVTPMIACIGLVVAGVLDVKTAFTGLIDSSAVLFVAMFTVGEAFFRVGMTNKIGDAVTKFVKTERVLIVVITVIVGMVSGVLFSTGTATVLIPVVIGIATKSGYVRSRLLMPLVFTVTMGENLSLIEAPGNLITQSVLQEMGLSFGFFEYATVGLPILVYGVISYATVGYKLLPSYKAVNTDGAFSDMKDSSNVSEWEQALSLVILLLTLLAMIFEDKIGIRLNISDCIGALALILTGAISEEDAPKSVDLKTIFLFGGTSSLVTALSSTGAGAEIVEKVIIALGMEPSPYILMFVVFVLCCILINFMSNTTTTALMVPTCLSIAQRMGADPRAVLMTCTTGSSCAYATPIDMPTNAMVVGAGGYKLMDYVKAGLPLIAIATVANMVILPIASPSFPQGWKIMRGWENIGRNK